jgi:hypothetical protein
MPPKKKEKLTRDIGTDPPEPLDFDPFDLNSSWHPIENILFVGLRNYVVPVLIDQIPEITPQFFPQTDPIPMETIHGPSR